VFTAITTADGLSSWWTTKVAGDTAQRGSLFLFDGGTMVSFWHQLGADRPDDAVASANFNWGYYLDSLRLLCETGQGKPYQSGTPSARVGATTLK
jgi:hypothetical protein